MKEKEGGDDEEGNGEERRGEPEAGLEGEREEEEDER